MKASISVKAALGIGAALVVLAFAPTAQAFASSAVSVPCNGPSGGSAGLITAINTLNSSGGGAINLRGCTYNFTVADNSSPAGANALPLITSPITINGHSSATLAGNSSTFRIFQVNAPSGNLTLNGLDITGGSGSAGGGIFNDEATLTLNDTVVKGNTAALGGGGIASGIPNQIPVGTAGTTMIENSSQVDDNSAPTGGGGGILNRSGTLKVINSEVNRNTSANGGGIASGNGNGGAPGSSSTLAITSSNVDGNTATSALGGPSAGGIANGGVATITNSVVKGNTGIGGLGGGIFNHGTMTLVTTSVNRNSAPSDTSGDLGYGGGIANLNTGVPGSGLLTINDSNVLNDSASGGGGGIANILNPGPPVAVGTVNLNGTTVNGNTAPLGGGIANQGTLNALNSAVNRNAASTGGGIANQGALNLAGSVVKGNVASMDGGGIANEGGTVNLTDYSAIVGNNPDNCIPLGTIAGCAG